MQRPSVPLRWDLLTSGVGALSSQPFYRFSNEKSLNI
jgi:hypothetical protein